MSGERFTSWLSGDERNALRELAEEQGCSENFVVRSALRALLFGKEPTSFQNLRKSCQNRRGVWASNTSNTSNASNHVTGART